jgi:hypothetical protein
MRFRAVVVDLDGTLLAGDGSITPRNRQALERARQAGLEVVVATGRTLSESRPALRAIDHAGAVIAAGGSLLCDARSGATVERRVMARDVVTEVTRLLDEAGHRALILKDNHATGYDYLLVGSAELDPASAWWFSTCQVTLRHADAAEGDEHPDDTLRAGAVTGARASAALARSLRQRLGARARLQHWPAVVSAEALGAVTHLLEVFHHEVNKWTMLQSWCRAARIDPADVVAVGDGLNDVELIGNVGLGVAMANADEAVRAVASRHTAANDQDGVAIAVEQVLSGAWT